ncbi:hypothetical protein CH267_02195 [Rhodococcus sp. 06-621-2]|nr:hypothetical protein [Rhodococcus sp. 06-621-2]OZC62370.1 hypothetical protein CH267_02195 [Rhodococcus sp. 06-621-2]
MYRAIAASATTLAVGAVLAAVFEAKQAGDILLLVAATVSWAFTILYATRSRWRLLNAGRSLLYVMLSLSIVLTQNAASIYLGSNYLGRGVIRVEMYWCLVVAVSAMTVVLVRIQHSDRRGGDGD